MSERVLTTLIAASAGLLGAFVGFLGSLIVSIRSARIGREQVRYARAYERRDEVLATLYGYLFQFSHTLLERASAAVKLSLPEADDKEEVLASIRSFSISNEWEEANRIKGDFTNYFAKNEVWIPDDISATMTHLFHMIDERNVKLRQTLPNTLLRKVAKTDSQVFREESTRPPAVVTAIKEFDDAAREATKWLEGDFSLQYARLMKRLKGLFHVEDD